MKCGMKLNYTPASNCGEFARIKPLESERFAFGPHSNSLEFDGIRTLHPANLVEFDGIKTTAVCLFPR